MWKTDGIENPRALLWWLDRKTAWDPAEVAQRLRITIRSAERLLRVSGFDYHERLRIWTVGTSKSAVRRRRRLEQRSEDSRRLAGRYRHAKDE